jgi:hypothetical protein
MSDKDMIDRRFSALEVRLDRHESKTDKILESLIEINKTLAHNTASLDYHIARTDTLQELVKMHREEAEREMELLEKQQDADGERIQAIEIAQSTRNLSLQLVKKWGWTTIKIVGILGMGVGLLMEVNRSGSDVYKFFKIVVGL